METLGRRLRRLRQAAGLSQSDLASAAASASYISLVEADKRTPSADVVRALAARLKCTQEYLLTGEEEPPTASARIEATFAALALAEGHPAAALARLEGISTTDLPTGLAEEIRDATARALLGVGDLERAIELLEPMLRSALERGRSLRALVLTNMLTGAYLEAGDLMRAVELAEAGLEAGRQARLGSTTEQTRLLATLSWALYERGDVYYARQRVREALPAVEAIGDPKSRGSLYWNAALFAQEAGHDEDAADLTRRALALLAEHSDQADLARLRLHLGWLLLRGVDADPLAALVELQAAEPDIRQYTSSIDVAYCLVEQARAYLALGHLTEALSRAERASAALRPAPTSDGVGEAPRYQAVQVHLVSAEVQDALGNYEEATAGYRRAAEMLEMMTTGRKAADVWGTLATRLQERGDVAAALAAYQRAMAAAGIKLNVGVSRALRDNAQPD